MDEEIRRTIGEDNMLRFHLNLLPIDDERGQLAWGGLIVTLEGAPVWCAESESRACFAFLALAQRIGGTDAAQAEMTQASIGALNA